MTAKKKGLIVLIVCCFIYGSAYLCRVNLSSALAKLTDGLGVTTELASHIGTAFFITYAFGQLINGYLIGRSKPHLVIMAAILGSGLLNLAIGLSSGYYPVLFFWGLNGVFQSLFWSTISRLIGVYAEGSGRNSVAVISISYPLGHVVSWSVIGAALASGTDWHPYFYVPAICLLAMLPVWLVVLKFCPEVKDIQAKSVTRNIPETFHYFSEHRLLLFPVICVINGMIRESVFFWIPLLLARLLSGTVYTSAISAGVVPLAIIPGVLAARYLAGRTNDRYMDMTALFYAVAAGAAVILSVFCLAASSEAVFLACAAIITFAICGSHSVMTAFIPIRYAKDNMSSSIIGVLDCCTYLGAAVSTYVLGTVMKSENFNTVSVFWMISSLSGLFLLLAAGKVFSKKKPA